ncbi:hypothetical protein MOJ79_07095 [Calidifontimicrobium sp. SYSU G02091]|uniref:hypothetical protein n=1 Tax=Calidifontimicrobium sp. SYSU G02091 TaxID=2926421 RepID=UPI001F53947A|nr:hypothetical protein [Calidifontimicrobium sp. SYSU G02091]MCI1191603.1 hypothetical protein [Calidifontimicrobium sp. SYSU G02091]
MDLTSDAIVTSVTNVGKRFATLRACAALLGATLHRLEDGRYLLARWGLSRELDTLDDAAALLDRMGGGR